MLPYSTNQGSAFSPPYHLTLPDRILQTYGIWLEVPSQYYFWEQ